jgi:hypothetical protein
MPAVPKGRKVTRVREMTLSIGGDQDFDSIVETLRKVWVVPELPGIKGCNPCKSGLDRFVIEDDMFRQIGQ